LLFLAFVRLSFCDIDIRALEFDYEKI